ncbi:uncharacterized protein LOC111619819 [Centruroides sculpturatus]|uniref:uncharacterized protein LOC111619819 n=1 Tax=Centruroides sculpturatus TaxID=218467 RepID=UPI000C6DE19C|nr:uncharacterized protein LOC111619819 [Centruroides sculpturatus]
MNGHSIKIQKTLKYLGVVLDFHLSCEQHIKYICDRVGLIFHSFARVAKNNWGLNSKAMSVIYDTIFVPIVTYGCGTWGNAVLKSHPRRKLISAQRTALLRIAKAYRTAPNSNLQVICKKLPIDQIIKLYSEVWNIKWGNNITTSSTTIQADMLERPINYSNSSYPNEPPNFIHNFLSPPSIDIYTDGSKIDNQVGCSFVVFQNGTEIFNQRNRLHGSCSVFQSELLAIKTAIDWCSVNFHNTNIALHSDSNSAISLISHRNLHPIAYVIHEAVKNCSNSFSINWVHAHQGIIGNERADALAKSAATDQTLPIIYNKLSLTAIKKLLWNDLLITWQNNWDNNQNITYQFFPDISAIFNYKWITPNFKLTQFLTNHGRFHSYISRFVDPYNSGLCTTYNTQDGSLHYILHCAMLDFERTQLQLLISSRHGH